MRHKLRSHIRQNVVGYIALFVALGGTGAYASHLVVNSSDVVNESLLSQDVKGRVGTDTTPAVNGTLTGADISGQPSNRRIGQRFIDGSLTTSDIKDGTLTANDINPATLGTLTRGRAVTSFCNPESTAFVDCGTVTLFLTRQSRALIVASGMWYSVSGGPTRGVCRITVDGVALEPSVFPGQLLSSTDSVHEQAVTLTNVTAPLGLGDHTIGLACNQEQGNIDFDETFVSVALLGSD
jgi:hypothetical protein